MSKTILVFSPAATHTGSQLKTNLVMEQKLNQSWKDYCEHLEWMENVKNKIKEFESKQYSDNHNNSNQKAESEPNIESGCQREWRNWDVYRFARACLLVWPVNKFN